jgi:dTDP-glucose 4,6-dehydratase
MTIPAILVTGGAGFIGSNLVRRFCASGKYRVINLDKLTYAGNLESLSDLIDHPHHILIKGDIADRGLVKSVLEKYRPAAVLNLAAESHVDRSIASGFEFIQTNVMGTFLLLEETRQYWQALQGDDRKRFRFVHVSTDEVYGTLGESGRFNEQTPYAPNSPYSASKASSDHFVRAAFHTYQLPTITTHCSNNYGPFQFPEKLNPLMITNTRDGLPLPVYGDGGNTRDWIHVEDHCAALELVLTGKPGEVFDIGANSERKNIEVVRLICRLVEEYLPAASNPAMQAKGMSRYEDLITFVTDRPGHDWRYAIDSAKINHDLGWSPQIKFDAGLRQTVRWYLDHPEWIAHVQSGDYRKWVDQNYSWRLEEKL